MKKEILKLDKIPVIVWGKKSPFVYVFVHGRSSNKEEASDLALLAIKKGIQVISFDFPEHGERRADDLTPFSIQNCVNELNTIINYVNKRWRNKSLFASSIGAYFSLVSFQNIQFKNTLFISPLLNMEELIKNMMIWFNVDLEKLEREKIIDTPMGEKLSWEYLQYVTKNPINKWQNEIKIIIGDNDELTNLETIKIFTEKFNCKVEFVKDGKHYLNEPSQKKQIGNWLENNLK